MLPVINKVLLNILLLLTSSMGFSLELRSGSLCRKYRLRMSLLELCLPRYVRKSASARNKGDCSFQASSVLANALLEAKLLSISIDHHNAKYVLPIITSKAIPPNVYVIRAS